MAIPATAVWEFRDSATAGNVNGGFFNAARGGTDYTLQDAAQLTLTDCTTTAANAVILRSVTGGFTSQMAGNGIYISSGTNFQVGWYEIVTYTSSNEVTLDRTPSSGAAGSGGNVKVGGAMSLNSTLDDELFESFVAGNIGYIKNGTFTLGEAVSIASTSGTGTSRIKFIGYDSTRGDSPTGDNRPLIVLGANLFSFGQYWEIYNIRFTGTASPSVQTGTSNLIQNCKILNTSTTANRSALVSGISGLTINCELISQNGQAAGLSSFQSGFIGNYCHDSNIGLQHSSNTCPAIYNLFARNSTAGISYTSVDPRTFILNNTIFGAVNTPIGAGFRTTNVTGYALNLYNNIFYGCATGISIATTTQDSIVENYNNFYNNTADRSNISTGPNSTAIDPAFTAVSELTGSTATTSGSVLTQTGADFSSVTDNVDFLRVVSGTGVTTGIYLITSHSSTTLTVNNALGTSSAGNVVWVVGIGKNFSIGAALKATGFPGSFNGSNTTGYLDVGAVQRQESTGGSGGSFTFVG